MHSNCAFAGNSSNSVYTLLGENKSEPGVLVHSFIDEKAKQLSFYMNAFWRGELPHDELELFFWDTLEEWTQVNDHAQPYSQKERVFWHVLHQVHFWPETKLAQDAVLHDELSNCLLYLDGRGLCPFDCIGIRP